MAIECYETSCPEHPGDEPFCHRSHCIQCDTVRVWPDGTWCFEDESFGMGHMSDDYITEKYDVNRHY